MVWLDHQGLSTLLPLRKNAEPTDDSWSSTKSVVAFRRASSLQLTQPQSARKPPWNSRTDRVAVCSHEHALPSLLDRATASVLRRYCCYDGRYCLLPWWTNNGWSLALAGSRRQAGQHVPLVAGHAVLPDFKSFSGLGVTLTRSSARMAIFCP